VKEKKNDHHYSRREFCGMTLGGTIGALSLGVAAGKDLEPEPLLFDAGNPTVALVRDARVWAGEGLKFNGDCMRKMVDRVLCLATGNDDIKKAWKTIVKPTDVVGIKINCLGGRGIVTRPDLVRTVVQCLRDAGVPEDNIIVWDRSNRSLSRGGFKVQEEAGKVRYMGTPGMGEGEYEAAGIPTRLSRFVTDACTVLINMPVMKAHMLAGFSGALKNYMGAIPNARAFHKDRCVAVGDLNALDPLRKKSSLVIMDALRPQWDKGPRDHPPARWKYHGIMASLDPVALDTVAVSILDEKRKEVREGAWPVDAPHIKRAGKLGLGQADPDKIQVKREENL